MSLFTTGIRPVIDAHLAKLAAERRDYGRFWSASACGYCMRRVIFDRLQIPYVHEDARKQRVFSVGHIFHEWIQRLTMDAGISIAQEGELIDKTLMVKGHFDDLVNIDGHFILYDYKTANSRSFGYIGKGMSHYHHMQLGTYMYMLRKTIDVSEARILKISKDDLRMEEQQLLWSPELEKEVVGYWRTLNGYWTKQKLPKCTCDKWENGFLAREAYNTYFWEGEPCNAEWAIKNGMEERWSTALNQVAG